MALAHFLPIGILSQEDSSQNPVHPFNVVFVGIFIVFGR